MRETKAVIAARAAAWERAATVARVEAKEARQRAQAYALIFSCAGFGLGALLGSFLR